MVLAKRYLNPLYAGNARGSLPENDKGGWGTWAVIRGEEPNRQVQGYVSEHPLRPLVRADTLAGDAEGGSYVDYIIIL